MVVDINHDRSENVRYDYPDYPIYVRRALLSIYPNYAADSHWHDDIELILILTGKMLYNVNGTLITLNAGEGILVNTRQLHYGFSDDQTECDFLCILFHPMLLCTAQSFADKFVKPVLSHGAPFIHLSPAVEWQNRILKYIREIYNCKDAYEAPLFSQGAICSLWGHLTAHTDRKSRPEERADARLSTLKTMIDFIHQNYSEKITLNDVAGAGNVSKRTCGNIFMHYLNRTPVEFLIDYRLRKAVELLKNTDTTMLEISLAVGFSGSSYFAETFRKSFGISPTEYRKQERNL
ncbi:MAG: helix-turn-helix transcriptional regulator [Lachnospiraceae bacterium]|nr:helix-turn-helix transcriptional regulator [Lachnospiraceae bacterium]